MNWKTWLPLAFALVLGLLAAKVARDLIVRGRSSIGAPKLGQIVIARRDMEPGQAIGEGDLVVSEVQAEHVPRNSFKNISELAGRVAAQPIVKDQPILESALAPAGSGTGPQALVPPGMRAVTVEVNEASGVGGLLVPGCRVDVVSTFQEDGSSARVARTIVQNVRVLAIGQCVMGSKKENDDAAARAKSVTLIVTPEQAELIELASNTGRTRLVMRGSLDTSMSGGAGVSVAELLGPNAKRVDVRPVAIGTTRPVTSVQPVIATNPPKTNVEPPKPRKRVIEVIVAGKSTTVEFDDPTESTELPGQNSRFVGDGTSTQTVIPGRSP